MESQRKDYEYKSQNSNRLFSDAFGEGINGIPRRDLIEYQKELLAKIKGYQSLSDDEFSHLILMFRKVYKHFKKNYYLETDKHGEKFYIRRSCLVVVDRIPESKWATYLETAGRGLIREILSKRE